MEWRGQKTENEEGSEKKETGEGMSAAADCWLRQKIWVEAKIKSAAHTAGCS